MIYSPFTESLLNKLQQELSIFCNSVLSLLKIRSGGSSTILFATGFVGRYFQRPGRRKTLSQNIRMKIGYARVSTVSSNSLQR
jgi:hypothetical protein